MVEMGNLIKKLDRLHKYYKFAKEEHERRVFLKTLNHLLGNLNKTFCRYCFLQVLENEIPLEALSDNPIVAKVEDLLKKIENSLKKGAGNLKENYDVINQLITNLNEKITKNNADSFANVSSKIKEMSSLLAEKKKLLSNKAISKILAVDSKVIIKAEGLLQEFQLKLRQDTSLQDLKWVNDKISVLKMLMTDINETISIERLRQKLKLSKEESEVINTLISGKSVPLSRLNLPLMNRIKEIFGDMAKISITVD